MRFHVTLACAMTLLAAASLPALASMPEAGSDSPAIPVLQSVDDGSYQPFDLKTASAGKAVVLYFFPQAFTSD